MSVAISCHEEKSIVLPDGNVTLPPDRLAVKPRYRLALAIILLHPFLVRFVLHFPLLGWLFTGRRCKTTTDICQQYSHVVTSHWASRVALQLRGTLSHACAFAYGRSKVENGRTNLIVLGQIVRTLFIPNFILCNYVTMCLADVSSLWDSLRSHSPMRLHHKTAHMGIP